MDRARVIALLREIIAELEADDEPRPAPTKRRARGLSYPEPLKPPSDTDRMRARKMLRRRGIYT